MRFVLRVKVTLLGLQRRVHPCTRQIFRRSVPCGRSKEENRRIVDLASEDVCQLVNRALFRHYGIVFYRGCQRVVVCGERALNCNFVIYTNNGEASRLFLVGQYRAFLRHLNDLSGNVEILAKGRRSSFVLCLRVVGCNIVLFVIAAGGIYSVFLWKCLYHRDRASDCADCRCNVRCSDVFLRPIVCV